jgi:hypothetical protein
MYAIQLAGVNATNLFSREWADKVECSVQTANSQAVNTIIQTLHAIDAPHQISAVNHRRRVNLIENTISSRLSKRSDVTKPTWRCMYSTRLAKSAPSIIAVAQLNWEYDKQSIKQMKWCYQDDPLLAIDAPGEISAVNYCCRQTFLRIGLSNQRNK